MPAFRTRVPAEGRSIGGCGKGRAVAFEAFEAKPGVKRYFPFLEP